VLAARVVKEGGAGFEDRLRYAYARTLGRAPRADEVEILGDLFRRHRTEFAADPKRARRLVGVGQAPAARDVDPVELAAWTSVARAILNLPELITRS
jgi:hypothetical protein